MDHLHAMAESEAPAAVPMEGGITGAVVGKQGIEHLRTAVMTVRKETKLGLAADPLPKILGRMHLLLFHFNYIYSLYFNSF